MKLSIDTTRDQPRLIRAAIAVILAAMDDGSALPLNTPANLILSEGERLATEQRTDGVDRRAPLNPEDVMGRTQGVDDTTAARNAFGAAPLAVTPAPSTAVAVPLPPAPAAPLATLTPPPAPPAPAPLPVPLAPAPTVLAAPLSPAPAGVDVDRHGLPWDSRIHAATKTKVADGSWKMKKGMGSQQTYLKSVEDELRRTMAVPYNPAASLTPAPLPAQQPAAIVPPPPPPAPVPNQLPPAVIPATAGVMPPTDFGGFMAWIAQLIAAGRWSHAQTSEAMKAVGLDSAVGLSARPDLIPNAVQTVSARLAPV